MRKLFNRTIFCAFQLPQHLKLDRRGGVAVDVLDLGLHLRVQTRRLLNLNHNCLHRMQLHSVSNSVPQHRGPVVPAGHTRIVSNHYTRLAATQGHIGFRPQAMDLGLVERHWRERWRHVTLANGRGGWWLQRRVSSL
jgi:hypothetical protein